MSAPRTGDTASVGILGHPTPHVDEGSDRREPARGPMTIRHHQPKGEPLTRRERDELAACAADGGEYALATAIGIGRNTVARAIAGLPIYGATRAVIRAYLAGEGAR